MAIPTWVMVPFDTSLITMAPVPQKTRPNVPISSAMYFFITVIYKSPSIVDGLMLVSQPVRQCNIHHHCHIRSLDLSFVFSWFYFLRLNNYDTELKSVSSFYIFNFFFCRFKFFFEFFILQQPLYQLPRKNTSAFRITWIVHTNDLS